MFSIVQGLMQLLETLGITTSYSLRRCDITTEWALLVKLNLQKDETFT